MLSRVRGLDVSMISPAAPLAESACTLESANWPTWSNVTHVCSTFRLPAPTAVAVQKIRPVACY